MTKRVPNEAILDLVRGGLTNAELCERLAINVRTYTRWRLADRDLGAAIDAIRAELTAERKRTTQAHGTVRRYAMGCRCDRCTEAQRVRHYEWSQRRRAALGLPPPGPRGRKRMEIRHYTGGRGYIVASTRMLIEQGIARGESTSTIMRNVGCDYETVQQIRAALDGAA